MKSPSLPEIVIAPPSGWRFFQLREIFEFRDLLFALSKRHIQVRYKQTVLGAVWALLQPAAAAAVFSLIFRNMVGPTPSGAPYIVFAYAGVLLWQFVASIVGTGSMSMVDNSALITKIYFPRLLIPLSVVGYAVVDFLLGFLILVSLLLWFGIGVGPAVLLLPLPVIGTMLIAFGVSAFLSALVIKYRDFRFVVPFLLQMWFFLSPVVYPSESLSPGIQSIIALNPMTGWIGVFRFCLLGGPFEIGPVITASAITLAVALGGVFYFRQVEDAFADIV